jgi:hypothetical protein
MLEILVLVEPIMEAWAKSHELDEWHCRVEDLIGTAYPSFIHLPNVKGHAKSEKYNQAPPVDNQSLELYPTYQQILQQQEPIDLRSLGQLDEIHPYVRTHYALRVLLLREGNKEVGDALACCIGSSGKVCKAWTELELACSEIFFPNDQNPSTP